MVYRGRIEKGVVVLEGDAALPEGTRVRVEAEEQALAEPARGSAAALLSFRGSWHGEPEEVDRLLEELREMKRAEVERQQNEPTPEL
jgi:hypothetical protein